MATADFMVIVVNVMLNRIVAMYWNYTLWLHTPACRFIMFLSSVTIDTSVWLTVTFTFDRLVAICCQKLKTKYCTDKAAVVVITVVTSLSILKNIPWPFLYSSYYRSVPLGCRLSTHFFILDIWIAFSWIQQLLTPVIPFFLILFFNIVTIKRILIANGGRMRLRQHSSDRDENDPELMNRRRSIVLLFAVSSSFILLWMTTVTYFMYSRITVTFKRRIEFTIFPVYQEAGIMLQLLSSCTNTAIYTVTQRKFRNLLFKVIKYPFSVICSH
ncbi:probable G-protein coupled receptor 139 [Scyliorhinus canicula]|uniref:probable G-protein coupled receptor 139 n=1 Tax=Scyliorhinus canicula TaxID=7830 RepID=UPI0018F3CEDF|nr:probable G-protein coupled receptor 139 [Scyliorhinus canicula]